jgi:hypothetical protein
VPLEDLPPVDEHAVRVAADPAVTWTALLAVLAGTFGGPAARVVAGALGCEPASTTGWAHPGVGSTVPGFRITRADPPELLVVAGRHRFSRYGIVFHLERADDGCLLRAESRAAFPGLHGALYRTAVIGTRGHVLATTRMLRSVARTAEDRARTDAA